MNLIKVYSSSKKVLFLVFSFNSFTIDFKICLYTRRFDKSHCPHDTFWLHIANSSKLWENKMYQINLIELHSSWFGTFCFQHLAYRHILKSIVKELKEKNQKEHFFGTWLNFNQVHHFTCDLPCSFPLILLINKFYIILICDMA